MAAGRIRGVVPALALVVVFVLAARWRAPAPVPPAPTPAADPGPVATEAQYAAIVTRYARPLRADAAALARCHVGALGVACVDRVLAAGTRGKRLAGELEAANLTGSASYVGAPPHTIAGLVGDTRYDSGRLATLAGEYRAQWAALTATLGDLMLELDAWTAYGVPAVTKVGGSR